ncbi:hypothetical protein [Microbacterium sp. NIBRBAC000506063]|uniref:hypothetical protein n=1 Tax=Microbacterium sp. NIBRBAC000506063 TaxID=2734618 RepID=UPI002948C437|nr:hypothetical protein [Microbacterium sp. NIBRBAC000506063]
MSQVQLSTPTPDSAASLPGVTHREAHDRRLALTVTDGDEFVRALVASGIEFSDLTVRGATLEEAFLTLTGTAADASARTREDA